MNTKSGSAVRSSPAPENGADVHLKEAEAAASLALDALAGVESREECAVAENDGAGKHGTVPSGSTAGSSSGRLSTIAVHGGEARQKPGDSITDPIFCASTYTFDDTQAVIDFIEEKQPREEYGRYGNPGERVAERKLAALEGGEMAVLFSSGMAAIVGLLMAKLNAGDEVIFFDECYHRSREFCTKHLSRFGVKTRQVQACDYDAMEAAITPKTRLLGERVADQSALEHRRSRSVRRHRPAPRRRDADRRDARHAATTCGRSRRASTTCCIRSPSTSPATTICLAGVVIGTAEKLEPVRKLRGIMGAINSPQNCYLLGRGLKTFELRMQRHNENGQAVAEFLASHPRIEKVYYPGPRSHPYHDVAKRTMRGFGGLVTFLVKDADWRQTAASSMP